MKNNLIKARWLGIILMWCITISLSAQQIKLTGQITGSGDGNPIPGANIMVKGTTNGTISDFNGNYSIMVMSTDILVFSSVGFETLELPVGNNTVLNLTLEASDLAINEVIVIGYGQVRKDDATGALLSVDNKDFNKGAITSPQELLSGKISGVQITNTGGAPGSGTTIRIRGGSSLAANNDPLIIIDGLPVDNDGVSGMSNPLSTINPNDIETFTVLKDASATAIYGSRASNGVIIITTKKGTKSGMKVNYTGNVSMGIKTNEIGVFNADEYRNIINDRFGSGSNAAMLMGTANTNWQDQIFQNALGHDHLLSIAHSLFDIPFRASVGYTNQEGILKTSSLDRITGSINLSPSFLKDHVKADINLKAMNINNRFASTGAIGNAILYDPTQEVYNETGAFGGYTTWMDGDKPSSFATTNPVALLEQTFDESKVKRYIGNLKLTYNFHFLPELSATLNTGFDYSFSDGSVYVPEEAAFEYREASDGSDQSGVDRVYSQDKKNQLFDFYLNYTKDLGSIKSKLDVMAGYSWQHFWRSDYVYATSVDGEYLIAPEKNSPTENYLISFFGRLNYAFMDRYLFTLTLRQDGTSRFSEDNRWGTFPSMALAWRINQESFLKNSEIISNLKLRLGYGITGQQYITSDNYPYLARYSYSQSTARYLFGDQWITMARPAGYDSNLKWEETTTYNIGLDYGFYKERISGSIEFYQRDTKDLINEIPVAAGTNFTNILLTNVGNIENKGIEFNINLKALVKNDLSWDIGFNFTRNTNKITKLIAVEDEDYQGAVVGRISSGTGNYIKINSVGYPANSFFVYQQVYDADGQPIEGLYADRDQDGEITELDKYHFNSSAPNYLMGISSRLTYKNWDFSFSGRASLGNFVYSDHEAGNANYQYVYNGTYIQNIPKSVLNTEFESQQLFSDFYVRDASFFRMDNISLGYLFTNIMQKKINLKLSLTAQNVFLITGYSGLDPEVFDGIDNNIYPRPTTILFGLNLDF